MPTQSVCSAQPWKCPRARIFRKLLSIFVGFPFPACFSVNAQTPIQQYVYASVPTTSAPPEIAVFSKDSTTGALSPLSAAVTPTKLEGGAMAIDALGRFLFVLDPGNSKISMFQVDRNSGALTEVPASPFSAAATENPNLAPTAALSLATEASGQFLYVGYAAGNFVGQSAINAFLIDSTDSQLLPLPVNSSTDLDSPPFGLIADAKGRYLYAGMGPNPITNNVDAITNVYKIDPLSGQLLLNGSAGNGQHFVRSIALDPRGRFFFEAWGTSSGSIGSAFISPVDGTALSGISLFSLQPGELAVALVAESSGKFLYVQQTSGVATYAIDQATGALTPSQAASSLLQFTNGKAVADPLGPYFYALQNDGVRGFQIDPIAGGLTALAGSPFAVGANGGRGLAISGSAVQAIAGPVAVLFPTSKVFGSVTVGQSSNTMVLNVTNTGDQTLIVNSIGLTGPNAAEFAVTPNCPVSLGGGGSCSVSVVFSPRAAGSRTAALSVADNAPGSPQMAQLSGIGEAPLPGVTLAPGTVSFATTDQGTTSAPQAVTLTNSGAATLHITSIAMSGANTADFLIAATSCNGAVAISANCSTSVTFSPLGNGVRTASISISDDAPGSPHMVQLTGSGAGAPVTRPGISISPTSISFSPTTQGTSSLPQSVTLTSAGSAPLHLSSITLGGSNSADFTLTSSCAAQAYVVSASCTVAVAFTPTAVAVGPRSAFIAIVDDAAGSPQFVQIGGLAQTIPDPITTPGSALTFTGSLVQVVKAGQTASYNLQLMPGFTGTLTLQCAGAPRAAACSVPASMMVTGGTPYPLTITVSTTSAGAELFMERYRVPPTTLAMRFLCVLLILIAACFFIYCHGRDGYALGRRFARVGALAASLLVASLAVAGCGGGGASAQSVPVPQSIFTPSGTSTIVLQPSATAANGKPVGIILPIQLTLTVQ